VIFHLVDAAGWALAIAAGEHRPASLGAEGFVHLSTRAQVLGTANRFFAGRTDLLLLHVDEARLPGALRYEEGEPGQRFPHHYGPLPCQAVVRVVPLKPSASGAFEDLGEREG